MRLEGLGPGDRGAQLQPRLQEPHEVEVNYRNPEELMQKYLEIARRLETAQNTLKAELMAALEGAQ